ncbi:unnamed protein product [Candida parapsilosis]|uniref:Uncharacterized protein n=1 Tax=Candida parapsilosis (strain CDC 317 / ATCC MYA-4646) TaxID=578454 RepID=G8BKQ8_CANPC|nr:uncharacterized protein CPAR2_703370 [Candida parapsilosis]CAD1812852.1 unnamed protein product [Candida parapsilosis]CCE45324.1 hypothetical protein CPAR2_703370 [Candida parapsilosis]
MAMLYTKDYNLTVNENIVSQLLAMEIFFPYRVPFGPHQGKVKYTSGDFVGCFKDLVQQEQESIKIKVSGEWFNYHCKSGRKLKFSPEFVKAILPELEKSKCCGQETFPEAGEDENFITVSEDDVISTIRAIVGNLNLKTMNWDHLDESDKSLQSTK